MEQVRALRDEYWQLCASGASHSRYSTVPWFYAGWTASLRQLAHLRGDGELTPMPLPSIKRKYFTVEIRGAYFLVWWHDDNTTEWYGKRYDGFWTGEELADWLEFKYELD